MDRTESEDLVSASEKKGGIIRAVIKHSHVICCGHVPANPSRTHSEDQQHGQLLTGHVLNLHAVSPGNSSDSQPVHHKIPEPAIKDGRHFS